MVVLVDLESSAVTSKKFFTRFTEHLCVRFDHRILAPRASRSRCEGQRLAGSVMDRTKIRRMFAFLPAMHRGKQGNANLPHQITSQQLDFVSDFTFYDDFAPRLTMRPKKRRQSWPLQAKQHRRNDRGSNAVAN